MSELLQIAGAFGGAFSPVATFLAFWHVSLKLQSLKDRHDALLARYDQLEKRVHRLESHAFNTKGRV